MKAKLIMKNTLLGFTSLALMQGSNLDAMSPSQGLRTAGLFHFAYQDGQRGSTFANTNNQGGSSTFSVGQLTLFLDADIREDMYFTGEIQSDLFTTTGTQRDFYIRSAAVTVTDLKKWNTNLQFGKFNTVFGSFVDRRLSIDNPLFDAPLAYSQHVNIDPSSGWVSPDALNTRAGVPFRAITLAGRNLSSTGVKLFNRIRGTKLSYAASITNNPASNNKDVNVNNGLTVATKLHWQADHSTGFGMSLSQGGYLDNLNNLVVGQTISAAQFARRLDTSNYKQTKLGLHFKWKRSRYQIHSEYISSAFDVPNNPTDQEITANSVYVEGKYDFTKNFFAAGRFDSMNFENNNYAPIFTPGLGAQKWDDDVTRIELGVGNYINESTLAKFTYQTTDYDRQTFNPDFDLVSGSVTVVF